MSSEKPMKPMDTAPADDIEALIEKKLVDAKLHVTESRVNWLLAFMAGFATLFGLVVPLWLTGSNVEKVDKAIQNMENRFKELAADQLRSAEISCEFEGRPLLNARVSVTANKADDQNPSGRISLRNIGDRSAGEVRVYLLLPLLPPGIRVAVWDPIRGSELAERWETDDGRQSTKYELLRTSSLHAKRDLSFWLAVWGPPKVQETELPATLEIFYDAPEPLRIPFSIRILAEKGGPGGASDSNTAK